MYNKLLPRWRWLHKQRNRLLLICVLPLWLLSILFPVMVCAQAKRITGVVKTATGESIPGATITLKGTNLVSSADANGYYQLSVPPSYSILVFSFIGYESKEVAIGGAAVINATLNPTSSSLDEVVVVGYGTQKRSDLTGAVASVNMKDFEKAPVKSYDQALAGRVAGVQVTTGSGQPGTVADIVIRGAGSITQDNAPLFVIDGFPSESSEANAINPSDIESIDVLKDASATAIYGARGSNGVILITTKRGKVGAPKVNYNAFIGATSVPKTMDLMGAYDYVKLVLERNPDRAAYFFEEQGVVLEDYRGVDAIDWQDHIYQTGINQNHDLSLRGGANNTTYAVSLNYNNQDGIIKHGSFDRYQGRIVLDQKISDKLKVGINSNYAYQQTKGLPVNATEFYASAGFLYSVWGYRPVAAFGTSADELLTQFYDPTNNDNGQDYRVNPVINLANQLTAAKTLTSQTNGYAEYAFTPNLSLRISGGYNKTGIERNVFNNSQTQSGSRWHANGPNGLHSTDDRFTLLNENTLTYKKIFKEKHNVSLLAGYGTQSNKSSFRSMTARQIQDEAMGIDALDMVPPENTVLVSRSSEWRLQSYFARANYNYRGKYLLTANFRSDGSSKFAPGNRWGYFPSASAAWRFSREGFAKRLDWLSDGKIRMGYGASGNNRVGDFAYYSQANLTNIQYWYAPNNQALAPGFAITAASNPDLRWETNKQSNFGLDLSLFKKRVDLTVDVYKRVTEDLLLNAPLPHTMGLAVGNATGFKNIGRLENKGLEITIGTTNIRKENLTWTSSFNISFNKNRILELTEGATALLAGSGSFFDTGFSSLSPYISLKGGAIGDMYGLVFDGIYQYADFDRMPNGSYVLRADIPDNGATRANIQPGHIKYKDLNGDLRVDANDYTVIGRGLPIHTGGFSNNLSYKNWDLNVFLQWSYGNNIINANRYIFEGGITNNITLNQFASYVDRWTPENPSNEHFAVGGMGAPNYSSKVVEDGSYLRLKTIQLGYNFSDTILKKMGINGLNVNLSAQNLLTFTKYSGLDPESSARKSNLTPGFDYGTYPQPRTLTFGLNATF